MSFVRRMVWYGVSDVCIVYISDGMVSSLPALIVVAVPSHGVLYILHQMQKDLPRSPATTDSEMWIHMTIRIPTRNPNPHFHRTGYILCTILSWPLPSGPHKQPPYQFLRKRLSLTTIYILYARSRLTRF